MAQHERWFAAMPKSIRPVCEESAYYDKKLSSKDIFSLNISLAEEFPDTLQRVLALFSWFGSGEGPWAGFISYELVAERLLLMISTQDLIAAAQMNNLTETQLEGAARLFFSGGFTRRRPSDCKKLPPELKNKLLEHVLQSTDKGKISRAKSAFEQQ